MPNKIFGFNSFTKSPAIVLSLLFFLAGLPFDLTRNASIQAHSIPLTTTPIPLPPGGSPLPFHKDCSNKLVLTVSDLDKAWQTAVKSAANTWLQAGSTIKISTTTNLSSKRTFTALDYDGNPIKWSANTTLTIAKCEIRVIPISKLSRNSILSFSKKPESFAGWVQPYPDAKSLDPKTKQPKYAIAYLLVLNNRNFKWSTGSSIELLKIDVETIALHELGHALGIEHLPKNGTVMSGTEWDHGRQWLGDKIRTLTQDDKDALIELYGMPISKKPSLTLKQTSNCREGTSKAFEIVYSFPKGTTFEIKGTDGSGWWLVPINMPEKTRKTSCWIYGEGNVVSGDTSNVRAVATPPLPEPVSVPSQNGEMPVYDFYSQSIIDHMSCSEASAYEWEKDVWSENGESVYFSSALFGDAAKGVYERDAKKICGW